MAGSPYRHVEVPPGSCCQPLGFPLRPAIKALTAGGFDTLRG